MISLISLKKHPLICHLTLKFCMNLFRYSDKFFSRCEKYEVMNAEPNTQMLLKINVIETTFLGVLDGNCKTDYVVVQDGKHAYI